MKIDKNVLAKKLNERIALKEEASSDLVNQLNVILADTFLFYFKSHSFHWNVEGPNFNDYHAFLSTVYLQTHAVVDPLAEHIRMLKAYAPNSLSELIGKSTVTEQQSKPASAKEMFTILKSDNEKLIAGLQRGRKIAEMDGITDLANYFDELLTAQRKLGWMLDSLIKE
jgi:starvation-inducible DNA-binding protein